MTTNETAATASGLDDDIRKDLLRFLQDKTKQAVAPDQDIFADGLANSMFAMELVVHLESTYGIEIEGPDLRLDNFRTVDRMTALTVRLRSGANADAGGDGDGDANDASDGS